MKKLIFVLTVGLILGIATSASAVSVSVTATGDNWLWVWVNDTWTEYSNYWKWKIADTMSFDLPYGQTANLYFAVMNENAATGNPAGLLAQLSGVTFGETGTGKLLSNTADYWRVATVSNTTWNSTWDGVRPRGGQNRNPPKDPTFNPVGLDWVKPTSYGTNYNNRNVWVPISGIDGRAEWIWTANNYRVPSTMDHTAVFRVTATPTPEPATMSLLGLGLAGLLGLRRKKRVSS